jgi:hypothetical protein
MAHATITLIVTQELQTSQRTGKMRRYRKRMEILVQLRLRTQRNCSGMMSWRSFVMGSGPYAGFAAIAAVWSKPMPAWITPVMLIDCRPTPKICGCG